MRATALLSSSEEFDWQAALDLALAAPRTSNSRRDTASWTESRPTSPSHSTSSSSEDDADDRTYPTPCSAAAIEMQPCGAFCERCGSPLPLIPCFHVARFLSHFMAPPPSSKKNGKRKADAVLDIDTPASPPAPASTGKDPQRPNPRIGHASDAEAGPSTSARASKKTRLSDKDQLANVTRKLQETEALLKSARDEANRYRKYKQKYCQDKSTRASKLIPRPDGERGKNGWTIRGALQLEDNGDLYLTILASVRDAITAAGLDWRQTFPRQEPSRLTDCYRLIKEQNPYLKRFEGDWPARELVISALQNKRKTRGRKRRREVQQDIGDGGGGDGELNSGDESEGLSDQDEE